MPCLPESAKNYTDMYIFKNPGLAKKINILIKIMGIYLGAPSTSITYQ